MSQKFIQYRAAMLFVISVLALIACKQITKVTSDEQAYQIVQGVPEVKEYVDELVRENTKPYMRLESNSDAPFYEFYVGSSHPTHTAVWRRFQVDRKTGVVKVYDGKADEYISLDDWRERIKLSPYNK